LTFNRQQGFIPQKPELFPTTAVIILEPFRVVPENRFLWRIYEPKMEVVVPLDVSETLRSLVFFRIPGDGQNPNTQ
jgi:hypothetical protein